MNKTLFKKVVFLIVTTMGIISLLSGCGSKEEPLLVPTVMNFDGFELSIGASKIQDLVDAGFTVSKDKRLTEKLEETMPGMTYDVGIYFGKDNIVYGSLECLNDTNEPIPYTDSKINTVQISYIDNMAYEGDLPSFKDNILIDGVDLKELKPDEVDLKLKEKSEDSSETKYPDGKIYSKAYTIGDSYYSVIFNMNTQLAENVEVEMFHSKFTN